MRHRPVARPLSEIGQHLFEVMLMLITLLLLFFQTLTGLLDGSHNAEGNRHICPCGVEQPSHSCAEKHLPARWNSKPYLLFSRSIWSRGMWYEPYCLYALFLLMFERRKGDRCNQYANQVKIWGSFKSFTNETNT